MPVAIESMPPGFAELVSFDTPKDANNEHDPTFTLPQDLASRRTSGQTWSNSPIFASFAAGETRAPEIETPTVQPRKSPSTSPRSHNLRSGSIVPPTTRQTRSSGHPILAPLESGRIDKHSRYDSPAKPDDQPKFVHPCKIKSAKKKHGKNAHSFKINEPLSVLTKHMTNVPVRDMEAWVNRPAEDRRKEPGTRKGAIARPMNSFMLYRSAYADRCKAWCDLNEHQVVSVVTGQSWQLETASIKDFYTKLADVERDNHQIAFPNYKFQPQKNNKLGNDDDSSSDDNTSRRDPDDEYRPKRGARHSRRLGKRRSSTPAPLYMREGASPPHLYPEVHVAPPHLYGRAGKKMHGQFINYQPNYGRFRPGVRYVPVAHGLPPPHPAYQFSPHTRGDYSSPPPDMFQDYQTPLPPFEFEVNPDGTVAMDTYDPVMQALEPIYEGSPYLPSVYNPAYDPVLSYVGDQPALTYSSSPITDEAYEDYPMIDPALTTAEDAMQLQ